MRRPGDEQIVAVPRWARVNVVAVGQMGRSTIVDTGDGRMAEIKADGTLGAIADIEHFMRNLGGYVQQITDPAAADEAVAVAADVVPPIETEVTR